MSLLSTLSFDPPEGSWPARARILASFRTEAGHLSPCATGSACHVQWHMCGVIAVHNNLDFEVHGHPAFPYPDRFPRRYAAFIIERIRIRQGK